MNIAEQLATFIRQVQNVPIQTQNMVRLALFDLITASLVGFNSQGARIARQSAANNWGEGTACCWFSNQKLPATGAGFVNSTAASIMDLDDGHRAAAGHPGAAIIPAVLAEACENQYSGQDIIIAIAIGYEIAIRISAARDIMAEDTLVSGRWVGQGVAAAVGWLKKISVGELEQSLAIAAAYAPNLNSVAYSKVMGNYIKEGIPWACMTGIAAVNLAQAGSTGPTDFLDNDKIYTAKTLTHNLGENYLIDSIYFKPYSCCRWAHAAIDALLELYKEFEFEIADIVSIKVKTFSRALQLNNDIAPGNLEAAQYSIPFCMGLALVRGSAALLPLKETSLNDTKTIELAQKITLEVDPEFDAMFSASVPAYVEVITISDKFSKRVLTPKGEPSNPMTEEDLKAKFDVATAALISPQMANSIKLAMIDFGEYNPKPILNILSQPIF